MSNTMSNTMNHDHCTLDRRIFLAQLSAGMLAACGATTRAADDASSARHAKTVRLLTIGNSFSGNATRHLGQLVKSAGHVLVHRSAAVGGASLELHWTKAERHERDPKDKDGLYSNGKSLKQELAREPWDFVTIQQASIKSHDVATYRPFARQLADYIHRHAPQSQLLLHETWAYRCDDPRFSVAKPAPGEPTSQEAMYRGLSSAYRTIAAELGARIIPVGDAYYRADTDPTWGYRPDKSFDPKKAQPPALPNQDHSLHVGWRWVKRKDGKQLLQMDGHHANLAGEYLGACVFYGVLYDESPSDLSFVPEKLDADYARFLRQTAARAVQDAAKV
jgi:hypothetical protein